MGTSLTGLTPATTYDALIKVTDNGSLSGTAKYLSDGLGNDSVLALSTSNVGIGTTSPSVQLEVQNAAAGTAVKVSNSGGGYAQLAISSNATSVAELSFTNSLSLTGGNVGIGTSTSTYDSGKIGSTHRFLNVQAGSGSYAVGTLSGNQSGNGDRLGYLTFVNDNNSASYKYSAWIGAEVQGTTANQQGGRLIFATTADASAAGPIERIRIDSDGLKFNGDTAAANALYDYEEGDWTPAITFGGGSTGITYASRAGKYTKIGRQVSVTGYILLTSKGSSTGSASIEGLPFVVGNAVGFYSAATLGALSSVTFSGVPSGYGAVGGSKVELVDTLTTGTQLGISNTNFTNSSQILLQFTYFV